MNPKNQNHSFWPVFLFLVKKLLIIPVVFMISPYLVFLVVKSSHDSLFPAIIKVQRNGELVSKSTIEYRIHPALIEKSKILQIMNKIMKIFSLPTP